MYPSLLRWEQNVFWIGLRKCNALPATIIFTLILVQREFWKGEIVFRVQSESPETWDLFLVLGKIRHLPWLLIFILLSVKRSFCCLSTFLFPSWVYSIVSLECYWKSGWGWGRELEKSMWTFMLCKLVMPEYVNIRSVLRITKENFPYSRYHNFLFSDTGCLRAISHFSIPTSVHHLAFIGILFLFSETVCYYIPSMHMTKRFHAFICALSLSSISWEFLQLSQHKWERSLLLSQPNVGFVYLRNPLFENHFWKVSDTFHPPTPPQLKLALNLLLAGKE